MWTNYHTHSTFCDGKSEMSEVVTKARKLQIKSLGFSSHAPLPFDCKWCLKANSLNEYLNEIENQRRLNSDIEIYKGLEVDYIPDVISPYRFRKQLDYTIGSVHFVEKFDSDRRWEIDSTHQAFLEGFEKIFNKKIRDVVARYFELTREMVTSFPPTIVGHIDKIKIQNIENKFFSEGDSWYREEVIKTIKAIADSNCIVEVNTRGLYQKKSSTTYPSPWILEHLLKKKIPVTLNSDAHHPDDLTGRFEETAKLLHEIGFRYLSVLREGRWQPTSFNEYGIT